MEHKIILNSNFAKKKKKNYKNLFKIQTFKSIFHKTVENAFEFYEHI